MLDGEYSIPIKRKNHKYIGIGNVTAKIRSKEPVDFAKLEIEFENISFDSEYESLGVTKNGSSRYPDTINQGIECLRRPEALVELFNKIDNIVGGFYYKGANRWYMSDEIDGIAKECFPSCTCVLYSSNKPRVGFDSNAMYFYDYDESIRYEDIEKISYGYEIRLTYNDDYHTAEVVSFGRGVSHQYEMAIFFDIIANVNFIAGGRPGELRSIRLQSCNNRSILDIIRPRLL